jgi:hypothetical protein
MSRASEDLFDQLHLLTVETLMAEIAAYKNHIDPETGKKAPLPVPPALLAQAIKLLKDNGVDSPGRAEKVIDRLAADLPNFDEFDSPAAHGVPH